MSISNYFRHHQLLLQELRDLTIDGTSGTWMYLGDQAGFPVVSLTDMP